MATTGGPATAQTYGGEMGEASVRPHALCSVLCALCGVAGSEAQPPQERKCANGGPRHRWQFQWHGDVVNGLSAHSRKKWTEQRVNIQPATFGGCGARMRQSWGRTEHAIRERWGGGTDAEEATDQEPTALNIQSALRLLGPIKQFQRAVQWESRRKWDVGSRARCFRIRP